MTKENITQFVNDHIREFPLQYGCTSGGWPDDKNIKVDVISSTETSYRIIIWFDEIVSKACSCIGDNNETYLNKVAFKITFGGDKPYNIEHEEW